MIWKITPILAGEFGMVRDDIKFLDGNPGNSGMVPSYIFLLENGQKKVLVDTSFGDPKVCGRLLELVVRRQKPLETIFKENGFSAEEIDAVILTHLHWDHAGNCGLFPNSKIYCQKVELETAFMPDSGYPPVFLEGVKKSMRRVVTLDGDAEIWDGIAVIHCGGHTSGSQMVEVRTGAGTVVITGDTVMTYENVRRNIPVGLCAEPPKCREALAEMQTRRGQFFLPSHDYRTLDYISNIEKCRI